MDTGDETHCTMMHGMGSAWTTQTGAPGHGRASLGVTRAGAHGAVRGAARTQYMLTLKFAETWPVCTVCNRWVMLLVCMGKTHFGGIIWGEVVMMHAQKFPISTYFLRVPAYLLKGCTLSIASADARGAHGARCAVRGAFQHPLG